LAISAVVTDIEGTTTPISFVADTLFPYARVRLADFVRQHGAEPAISGLLDDARALAGRAGLDAAGTVALLLGWMDEDRKATPLKELQGLIWAEGYAAGDLRATLYPDVVPALDHWRAAGCTLHIYSSGSVAAQRLLFGHTEWGDLTPLFRGYFDTRIGAKVEADSYRRIAAEIAAVPAAILFLSDSERELDAAREAGFATARLARDGAVESRHPVHASFATIVLS
jgi:enolase-phosphatase E1